jgi:hypothetical protein
MTLRVEEKPLRSMLKMEKSRYMLN